MSTTRADLLAVAEGIAAEAKRMIGRAEVAGRLAGAAKTALEAAHLAQDTAPAEHVTALRSVLEALGVGCEEDGDLPSLAAAMLGDLAQWRAAVIQARRVKAAYGLLSAFAAAMERDWLAADSGSSRRLAARARAALDEAGELLAEG